MSLFSARKPINESRVADIIGCGTATLVVAYIAVGLRLWARSRTVFGLGMDDYVIIVAVLFCTVYVALSILACRYGLGKHGLEAASLKGFVITMTAVEMIYILIVLLVKTSILTLYLRLFPVAKFRVGVWAMMGINVTYNAIFLILTIVQCLPVRSRWNPEITGICLDYYAVVLSGGVLNITTDIVMLAMPVPVISRLQMPRRRKFHLSAVFGTGTCACIIAVVRCVKATSLRSQDSAWDEVPALQLSLLEHCIGIISACVPTYRPLTLALRVVFSRSKIPRVIHQTAHFSTSGESFGEGRTMNATTPPKAVLQPGEIWRTNSVIVSSESRVPTPSAVSSTWHNFERQGRYTMSGGLFEANPDGNSYSMV